MKNLCPQCAHSLYHRQDTGKYHCVPCGVVFKLVKQEKRAALLAGMRLMVRFRPMLVPEVALRLGITSRAVRYRVAKAPDLYIFDGLVHPGARVGS